MTSEFNWWLLLVGIVVGAGLTWLVLADLDRTPAPPLPDETELELEADWIAARFAERDEPVDGRTITEALRLDRLYRTPDPNARLAPTRPRRVPTTRVSDAPSGDDRDDAGDEEPAARQ